MIAAALTALLVGPPAYAPSPPVVEPPAIQTEMELGDRALRFANPSTDWQVLLFGTYRLGVTRALRLAPGATLELPCSPESLDDLLVEVIQVDARGLLRSSGAIWLSSLENAEHGRAVMVANPRGLVTWVAQDGRGYRAATSRTLSSLVNAGGVNGSAVVLSLSNNQELNVPVITPRPAGNNRPIKRTPLPPV